MICDIFRAKPEACLSRGQFNGTWNPTLLIEHDNPNFVRPASAGLRVNLPANGKLDLMGQNDREMLVCGACTTHPFAMYMSESGYRDLRKLLSTLNCGVTPNKIGLQFERLLHGLIDVRPYTGEGLTFLHGKIYDPNHNIIRDPDIS